MVVLIVIAVTVVAIIAGALGASSGTFVIALLGVVVSTTFGSRNDRCRQRKSATQSEHNEISCKSTHSNKFKSEGTFMSDEVLGYDR